MSNVTKNQPEADAAALGTLATSSNECKCGCGQTAENVYRQGHDAKHVSILLSYLDAGLIEREAAMAALPTTALKVKLNNALARRARLARQRAERAHLRDVAKREREAIKAAKKRTSASAGVDAKEAGINPAGYQVKVGRWWYPVVELGRDGDRFFVAYTTKDGSTKEARVDFDKVREA